MTKDRQEINDSSENLEINPFLKAYHRTLKRFKNSKVLFIWSFLGLFAVIALMRKFFGLGNRFDGYPPEAISWNELISVLPMILLETVILFVAILLFYRFTIHRKNKG